MTDRKIGTNVRAGSRLLVRRLSTGFRYRLTGRLSGSVDPFRVRDRGANVPGAVLSRRPLIVGTASTVDYPLGLASALGPSLAERDILFVIYATWTVEGDALRAWKTIQRVRFYRQRFPRHRILLLVNTQIEAETLRRFGGDPLIAHQNMFVDETVFRPLTDAIREFDAVLNAKMSPFKRHALAREVGRLAVISFEDPLLKGTRHEGYPSTVRRSLAHATFVNDLAPSRGGMISRAEVNQWLNRAAVGLMLSAVEGGNFASTEYLLAGIPVVSTASSGGRSRYFDDADCVIADADPRRIAEAVAARKDRNIPRDRIRKRVMALIDRDRASFEGAVLASARSLPHAEDARLDMSAIKLLPIWRSVAELGAELSDAP